MAYDTSNERLVEKRDLVHIAILAAIALVIGVYLIATTVLIAKDGVFYIERAQQFASDPINIIKRHPPGYPFLILIAHELVMLFDKSSSVFTWIYSAQSITLLCRLLALIPLYFIGKLLVGGKNSFLAIFILVILPHSAKYCAEVLREWPYILLLATGLFFLLWGAKSGRWWVFGLAGLSSGLGYLIRPESAQLIVYGLLWITISMFRPKVWGVSRCRILTALALLFIGFAVPAAPYMKCTGQLINPKAKYLIMKTFSFNSLPNKTDVPRESVVISNLNYNTAEVVPHNVLEALGKIFNTAGENLMWFFMPALLIGFWCRFRHKVDYEERFLITAFVLLNLTMMIIRYCTHRPHVSQRWSLPLITVTVFYIPAGLTIIARHLENIFQRNMKKTGTSNKKCLPWFLILLLIGIGICLPKLLRPIGVDKAGYRTVAKWLNQNTAPKDTIVVPDRRIAFYAERQMREMQSAKSTISAGQITSGNWYHLAGTFDGEYQKLYINGELAATEKLMFKVLGESNNDLVIGKHTSGSTSYFKGAIDDVRLYGRALSTEEIKSLYNNDVPAIESSKLVGYWPLEGDAAGMDNKLNSAMRFNGTSDYIDLSDWGSRLNSDAITVSIWVKPELPDQRRWVIGSRTQFRIGVIKSKAYFWITEKTPGHEIPAKAAYVVAFSEGESTGMETSFNKRVQERYSVWRDKRRKKKRLVIYEVL